MFRASSAYLQEDIVVYMQHMVPLLSDRPPGTLIESAGTICCTYTTMCFWRWALDAWNM